MVASSLYRREEKACQVVGRILSAEAHLKKKKYPDAKTDLDKALALTKDACYDSLKAELWFVEAKYYSLTNNKDSAVAVNIRCIQQCDKVGNASLRMKATVNLGTMLNDLGQHERALPYLRKGLNDALALQDTFIIGQIYTNIAGTFGMWSNQKSLPALLDSVVFYQQASLPYARVSKNRKALLSGYTLMAGVQVMRKNYEQTLLYCDSALRIAKRGPDDKSFANCYQKMSIAYLETGNVDLSLQYADSAMLYAEQIGQVDQIMSALERVMESNERKGNFREAFIALKRLKFLKDSLESIETTSIITELEQRYNKAKNEEEITRLGHEAEVKSLRINILILGVVVLLVVLGGILVLFRQRTLRNKQQILETEQRLNRARMNPHFFFNALTSLQTYAMKSENSDKVPLYLARYSKIMRQTLESTYNELNPLHEEIDFIRGYLDMQKLMHPGKFDYVINIDEVEEDLEDISMPSMIVQPFIENSVEHGFRNIEYAGVIEIVFNKLNDNLQISIRDNGSSSGSTSKHEGYPSRATQIIADRLFLLDKNTGKKSGFEVGQNPDGKGYLVTISLPLMTS